MQFAYRAKQDPRTEATGVVEAVDLSSAVSHLKQMGLFPLEVAPLQASQGVSSKENPLHSGALSRSALSLWARTVGQGLKAGLSLTQALHLLAEQERERLLGQVAKSLEERVTAGMSLADAMGQWGSSFPPVAVSLIKAAEISGALEEVLQALAVQVESESELMAKVRGALVYPLFVLGIGVVTVAVLISVVVPKLALLFTETGQALPLLTRFLISSGKGLVWGAGLGVAAAVIFAVAVRQRWLKISPARGLQGVVARLPLFGRLAREAEVARLASTLSLLLGHGMPLPESLRLAADTLRASSLRAPIQQARQRILEGSSLSAALRSVRVQEPFLLTMIAMGEAQGDLALAFRQAAERYSQEADRTVKVLSTLVEPIMILLVGLVVGGIVFSMLLPIFQINFTVG